MGFCGLRTRRRNGSIATECHPLLGPLRITNRSHAKPYSSNSSTVLYFPTMCSNTGSDSLRYSGAIPERSGTPITFTVSRTRIRLPVVSVGLCFMILSICAGTLTECSLNLAHGLYQPQTLYERSRFEYLFFLLKVLHTCSNQGEAHRTLGFRSCLTRSGTPSTADPIFTSAFLPLRISTRGLFSTPGHRSRRWACPRCLGSEITGRAGVSGYIIQATTRHPKNLVG